MPYVQTVRSGVESDIETRASFIDKFADFAFVGYLRNESSFFEFFEYFHINHL